ncbi:MAG: ComEC/Rec2 family competence protein [Chthonomonadales bacterium]
MTVESIGAIHPLQSFVTKCRERPLISMCLFFAVGCALARLGLMGFVIACLVASLVIFVTRNFRSQSLLLAAGFFVVGWLRGTSAELVANDDVSKYINPGNVTIEGQIVSNPAEREGSASAIVQVYRILLKPGDERHCSGFATINLPLSKQIIFPGFGDRLKARGTLAAPTELRFDGGVDSQERLAVRDIHAVLHVKRSTSWSYISAGGISFGRVSGWLRNTMVNVFHRSFLPGRAALLSGIVVGSRQEMNPKLEEAFQATGTIHILATAGLHTGVVAGVLIWLATKLRLKRQHGRILAILCLWVFAFAAGGRPAVLRAVLMITIYLGSELLSRQPDGMTTLATAAFAELAFAPGLVFDPGFQLSFATVWTILTFSPLMKLVAEIGHKQAEKGRLQKLGAMALVFFSEAALLSLAAQIGSMPLTAQYFHELSFIGVFANLAVVPVVSLVMIAALLIWIVGLVLPVGAAVLAFITSPLLKYIESAVIWFASLPGASVNVVSPGWSFIAFYFVCVGFTGAWLKQKVEQYQLENGMGLFALPTGPDEP